MKEPDWDKWLLNRAAEHLGRFAASRAHLADILKRKILRKLHKVEGGEGRASLFDSLRPDLSAALEKALRRCEELGYLDDTAYAKSRYAALLRKGKPRMRIKSDLIQKGVPLEIVDALIEEVGAEGNKGDLEAAITFARKRRFGAFSSLLISSAPKPRDKQVGAMMRAGFAPDLTYQVLDHSDPESLLLED